MCVFCKEQVWIDKLTNVSMCMYTCYMGMCIEHAHDQCTKEQALTITQSSQYMTTSTILASNGSSIVYLLLVYYTATLRYQNNRHAYTHMYTIGLSRLCDTESIAL